MKAVVLDGFAFSDGSVDLSGLHALCDITYHDHTDKDKVIETIGDAEIIFTNKVIIDKTVLDHATQLKYIGVMATGYNVIDTVYARQKGVCVTNIPAYSTEAVAQQVFAYILAYYSKIAEQNNSVHNGDWANCPNFCYFTADTFELSGKTLGIIGLGAIGEKVAKIANAFSMNVIAYTRTKKKLEGVSCVDLDTVLSQSDIISLHCPLTEQTEKLINAQAISKMKPTALLINTSRGAVIDEVALADALNNKKLACACVDVLETEPPTRNNPLLTAKNCIITPHTAWSPIQTRQRCMDIAIKNLSAFLNGRPINVVN